MRQRHVLFALGGLLIAAAVAVTSGYIVWRMAKRAVIEQVFTPKEKTVDLSTLVTQVRELHRLETASMHVLHIGRVTQSYQLVPDALAGDEITFLAEGDVIAGIDLAQLQPGDIWRSSDGTINLRLPRAQILVTRVDNDKSRVINRKTGAFRRQDIDLETRARQNAEINIRNKALHEGVIVMATNSGEKKMGEFLHALGFERVRFVRSSSVLPNAER